MKIRIPLVFVLLSAVVALGQSYPIGHTTITFNDPTRTGGFGSGGGSGRQIQSEIYYPGTSAGEDVPVETGSFPVVVFGHGFVMAWDAYENVWEALVPEGYIVVFPRTEGGLSPSHLDFGMDLSVGENKMQMEGSNSGSLFFNHVENSTAIIGHSMGGGATVLGAASSAAVKTIVGLAPAETNPSAIDSSALITIPALVFSGSSDGVTPPSDHHIPIYNGINATCKYFISVTGGAHCYFANSNFNCDFGEATASSGITVTRTEQQTIMNDYLIKWLDYQLKSDLSGKIAFDALLASDTRITYQDDCLATSVTERDNSKFRLYPNPSSSIVSIEFEPLEILSYISITNLMGQVIMEIPLQPNDSGIKVDLFTLEKGLYLVRLNKDIIGRLIKN